MFQRTMDTAFRGLKGVFIYLDDVLVASDDDTEHLQHLRTLFERLLQNGFIVRPRNAPLDSQKLTFSDTTYVRMASHPYPLMSMQC